MPCRWILSAAEHESPLALPDAGDEVIRQRTYSEFDLVAIRQKRGEANRLVFAALLHWIGAQLGIDPTCWTAYAVREETIPEYLPELLTYPEVKPFGLIGYRETLPSALESG